MPNTCLLKVKGFLNLSQKGIISYLITRDLLQNIILKFINILLRIKETEILILSPQY
jgi:hypothetical protein